MSSDLSDKLTLANEVIEAARQADPAAFDAAYDLALPAAYNVYFGSAFNALIAAVHAGQVTNLAADDTETQRVLAASQALVNDEAVLAARESVRDETVPLTAARKAIMDAAGMAFVDAVGNADTQLKTNSASCCWSRRTLH